MGESDEPNRALDAIEVRAWGAFVTRYARSRASSRRRAQVTVIARVTTFDASAMA